MKSAPAIDEKAPVIEIKDLSKAYGSRQSPQVVIQGMDLVVPNEAAGEFIAVLGPSGSGKSTLLNIISGVTPATSGSVKVFGHEINGDNPFSVTVQQAYTCFPWRTVQRNVEFGLEIQGVEPTARRQTAQEYVEKVGLGDRPGAYPKELSGGMQQRVAIARCLAMKPRIVLMDEPYGALDAKIREDMQRLLLQLWESERNCVVFVTHDITEALILADRIIVVSSRPARIVEDMRVPFGRPRFDASTGTQDLTTSQQFQHCSQLLLSILKEQGSGGQVRVSV